jgi:hypothetical protein
MNASPTRHADLAAMAAAIERLAAALGLAEEPGGFAVALEQSAPEADGPRAGDRA